MKITGKIVHATKPEQITNTFRKRDLIVEIDQDTQYPQEIKVELHNNNCELITGMNKGDDVEVHINLRGRSYVNKEGKKAWFSSIVGWRVQRLGAQPVDQPNNLPSNPSIPSYPEVDEEDDDLPF